MGQTLLFINVGLVYKLHSYTNIDSKDPISLVWIKGTSTPYKYVYIHTYICTYQHGRHLR
jgi:hypothetical protein